MKKGCLVVFFSLFGAFFLIVFIAIAGFLGILTGHTPPVVDFDSAPVAVVQIEGPIFNEMDEVLSELEDYLESKTIKAVVLRINSPGGAIGPSQEVFRQVQKLVSANKIVVASLGTVAASGGYYMASAANKIVANSGTITGSIGVIMEGIGLQEWMTVLKLEDRTIKSGSFKDVGNPLRPQTEEEKAYLQQFSDELYQIFVKDVAFGRKMEVAKLEELARGKLYTGLGAKEVGLVDELGNLYDALALAKSLAGLPKNAAVKWPKEPTAFESFFSEKIMLGYLEKFFAWAENQSWPSFKAVPPTAL